MEIVAINRVETYDIESIKKVIREQFKALDVEIKKDITVVIKVNLVIRSKPDSVIITNPNVTAAVGLIVKELGANVLIAESSGGPYNSAIMKNIFSATGYTDIAEKHGFELYTDCKHRNVHFDKYMVCKSFDIVEPFIDADYIINIAKLKSHCMTMFSGAVKNLFGVVPGLMKPELHARFTKLEDFSNMLVDLCELVKPNLSILDAVYVMEGNGPTGGNPRFCGAIISSKNPYALDIVGTTIASMKSSEVSMLNAAIKRDLCVKSYNNLKIVGDTLEEFIIEDFLQPQSKSLDFIDRLPRILQGFARKLTSSKPVIKTTKCIGCGKCKESCPVNTIDIENGKATINYKHCIRCFCCHEMCPIHVIDVKKFLRF